MFKIITPFIAKSPQPIALVYNLSKFSVDSLKNNSVCSQASFCRCASYVFVTSHQGLYVVISTCDNNLVNSSFIFMLT